MIIEFRNKRGVGTTIYADFEKREIHIENHTDHILDTAFGINEHPTWEQFEKFLESRCMPRTMHHVEWLLADIGLDHYDPLSIIEKTNGRVAGDNYWLDIVEKDIPEKEVQYE